MVYAEEEKQKIGTNVKRDKLHWWRKKNNKIEYYFRFGCEFLIYAPPPPCHLYTFLLSFLPFFLFVKILLFALFYDDMIRHIGLPSISNLFPRKYEYKYISMVYCLCTKMYNSNLFLTQVIIVMFILYLPLIVLAFIWGSVFALPASYWWHLTSCCIEIHFIFELILYMGLS